ncbi:carboxypeptidase B-like [Amyelois transitella]|uniref:carboxypeptidase B-like n=1 Tax=Amyelois transitella TaxID=680683 RepID=UPI002990650E|nr:carboxypeptidase B-like [Amyelois transitella]
MTREMTINQHDTQLKLKIFEKPSKQRPRSSPRSEVLCEDVVDEDLISILTTKTENGTQTKVARKKGLIKSQYGILQRNTKSVIVPSNKPRKRKVKLMDWKRYHRLNVIYAFIDELERDYPAICTVSVIGKSVEGRDIKMLKISNSDANNSAVWLDASIHSREWISTAVVTYIADVLVKNFQKLSPSVTNKDWHIVPVLNPDGYEYSHTKDRMWRKNRAVYEGHCTGVDLNRNFSCGWGNNGEQGSSEEPSNIFYRGPVPFSEPETVAVRDTILGSTTPFSVFLSFHSYFEMIIFPWGYKKDACPDYLRLLEGAAVMARAIYDTTGMTYKVGSTKDMTYYACGTATDWSYGIAKIPFSYMIELRSRKYKFKLPKDMIMDTCVEIWNAVKNLMDYVDRVKS